METDIYGLPYTITDSSAWKELEQQEYSLGPDNLFKEILEKRTWTNVEIMWVLKRMIYFYGGKDSLLKKTPTDRLFNNMNDVLRVFYILLDRLDPDIDENMRSYISTKLADATWGISASTREYLHKF